jgi:hypothetical protein
MEWSSDPFFYLVSFVLQLHAPSLFCAGRITIVLLIVGHFILSQASSRSERDEVCFTVIHLLLRCARSR